MPILFLSRLSHFLRNFPLFLPTADSSLHGSGHLLFISCCKKDRSFASVQNGGSHSIASHPPSFTPYSYQEGVGFWDEVAEWLRRWTANPLCSARVGSNPILVVWLRLWPSAVAQLVKKPPLAMREPWIPSLCGADVHSGYLRLSFHSCRSS